MTERIHEPVQYIREHALDLFPVFGGALVTVFDHVRDAILGVLLVELFLRVTHNVVALLIDKYLGNGLY